MHPEKADNVISRSTILILCGMLTGIGITWQLSRTQQAYVAASCVVGIAAFVTVDGGIKGRLFTQKRKVRQTLDRRIETQKAFLESTSSIMKTPTVTAAAPNSEAAPNPEPASV